MLALVAGCVCGGTQHSKEGPGFGYFPNASKTWLVTKNSFCSDAEIIFAGTNVNLTDEGLPYLGAAIGTNQFVTFCYGEGQRLVG